MRWWNRVGIGAGAGLGALPGAGWLGLRVEPLGWRTFHGVRIPSPAAVTWLVVDLEEVAHNVDVSRYLRASGP